MSVQIERLINRLVEEGNSALAQARQPAEFAYDPDADAILNDLEQYPQAFVLACLCDRQGTARQAWMVPLRLLERFRTLDIGELAQRSTSDWERVVRQPTPIHRMPEKMAVVLERGVQRDGRSTAARQPGSGRKRLLAPRSSDGFLSFMASDPRSPLWRSTS